MSRKAELILAACVAGCLAYVVIHVIGILMEVTGG